MNFPTASPIGGQGATKPFAVKCVEPEAGPPEAIEVRVSGFLDAHTVNNFEQTMEGVIEQGYTRILMHLGGLSYISSAGIGALMVLLQQLRRKQGDMVILQPSTKVYKILDLLGFTKIFTIAEDIEAARRHLAP